MSDLIGVLEAQIYEADTHDSEVGDQRQTNHERYTLQPIGNEISGRSKYVDPSVMDVVESKKAFFKRVFFAGRRAVKFLPSDNETARDAEAKTAYVERQLKANKWYRIFRDGLHDAFVAKRKVVHVSWEEQEDVTLLDANGATPEQLQWQIQQHPEVIDIDGEGLSQDEQGLIHGTVRLIEDGSHVSLRLIRPENYYRDPEATYPDDAGFIAFDDPTTRGRLIRSGFDEDQVMKLRDDSRHARNEEDHSRNAHSGQYTNVHRTASDDYNEPLNTRWTYTWLNLADYYDTDDDGNNAWPDEMRLYQIRWCGGEVLRYAEGGEAIKEVAEMPFFEWEQYPISHASSGMCDADVVGPVQKQLSTFKRLVIDNQQAGNMSRYAVVRSGITDIKPLLNNTIGGIVPVLRPDAITPLPPPVLSPATMPAIEMLEQDKESRSGNSRLSKGLNNAALSNQNADNMVERLTDASNQRLASEARDYALSFLTPLMQFIYALGVRHDKRVYQLSVSGQEQQASPQQWSEPAPQGDVAVALTPQEGLQHAAALGQMHGMLSQDPVAGQLYGPQQRHALFSEMFTLLGVEDSGRFLVTPGSPEHMQQMQSQQQQLMQQQAEMQKQQQFQQHLMQSADQREWQRVQLAQTEHQFNVVDKSADNNRADEQLDHTKLYDFAKLRADRDKYASS